MFTVSIRLALAKRHRPRLRTPDRPQPGSAPRTYEEGDPSPCHPDETLTVWTRDPRLLWCPAEGTFFDRKPQIAAVC